MNQRILSHFRHIVCRISDELNQKTGYRIFSAALFLIYILCSDSLSRHTDISLVPFNTNETPVPPATHQRPAKRIHQLSPQRTAPRIIETIYAIIRSYICQYRLNPNAVFPVLKPSGLYIGAPMNASYPTLCCIFPRIPNTMPARRCPSRYWDDGPNTCP